jgi:phosphoglycerate dehydrogenase-like enzyme
VTGERVPLRVVLAIWQTIEPFHQALTTPATIIPAPSGRDEDVAPLLEGADVLVSGRFSRAMGERAASLRLIQTPGAGLDGIDLDAVPGGTAICNVYGHERGIAEYIFTTMSMLNRDFVGMNQRLRTGDWRDYRGGPLPELQGKTLGIIGLGRIGAEVARWGRFLDMRVLAATRTLNPERARELGLERVVKIDGLGSVLSEADFVVISVPLDAETNGLIGSAELAMMKPSAFLINVARGEVVDEAALYEALASGRIAGAAIDVWYCYPDSDQPCLPAHLPFHELPNVVMTPHIAGATDATFTYRWNLINENLRRLRDGEPLLNLVKPPVSSAHSLSSIDGSPGGA